MRILHFYAKAERATQEYVSVLCKSMCGNAESKASHSLSEFRKELNNWHPDIVHIHGCWHLSIAIAEKMALNKGCRIVLTPHGMLEPWVLKQKYYTDKLPKLLLYQRKCLRKAYAIIAFGRMEAQYLAHLAYNPRVETVLNSLITETITDTDMASAVHDIYRKVLDTDVVSLMDANTQLALRALTKVGIAEDKRWLSNEEYEACKEISSDGWHKISVFACQENINDIISNGIAVVGIEQLPPLYDSINSYEQHNAKDREPLSASPAMPGDKELLSILKETKKRIHTRSLRIKHLIELADMLRHGNFDENAVNQTLIEKKLQKHTARLMHVLAETTGLEEGFMLTPERDDRKAKRMEKTIIKHTKI